MFDLTLQLRVFYRLFFFSWTLSGVFCLFKWLKYFSLLTLPVLCSNPIHFGCSVFQTKVFFLVPRAYFYPITDLGFIWPMGAVCKG